MSVSTQWRREPHPSPGRWTTQTNPSKIGSEGGLLVLGKLVLGHVICPGRAGGHAEVWLVDIVDRGLEGLTRLDLQRLARQPLAPLHVSLALASKEQAVALAAVGHVGEDDRVARAVAALARDHGLRQPRVGREGQGAAAACPARVVAALNVGLAAEVGGGRRIAWRGQGESIAGRGGEAGRRGALATGAIDAAHHMHSSSVAQGGQHKNNKHQQRTSVGGLALLPLSHQLRLALLAGEGLLARHSGQGDGRRRAERKCSRSRRRWSCC